MGMVAVLVQPAGGPGCLLVLGREGVLAVVAAEQEREADEIAAERVDAVCLAADAAGQRSTELIPAAVADSWFFWLAIIGGLAGVYMRADRDRHRPPRRGPGAGSFA